MRYSATCIKDWLFGESRNSLYLKEEIITFNLKYIDSETENDVEEDSVSIEDKRYHGIRDADGQDKVIDGIYRQLYEQKKYFDFLNIPPLFILQPDIDKVIHDLNSNFVLRRFDNNEFKIKDDKYSHLSKRYPTILKVNKAICNLRANNCKAFENFCRKLLQKQGFEMITTGQPNDEGIDNYGYLTTFDYGRAYENQVEKTIFRRSSSLIDSLTSYYQVNKLRIMVQCKCKKYGSKLRRKDIVLEDEKLKRHFHNPSFLDKVGKKGLPHYSKRKINVWQLAKLLFITNELDRGAIEEKNNRNVFVRNGLQLSWDFIQFFGDYFDSNEEFQLKDFMDNFNV